MLLKFSLMLSSSTVSAGRLGQPLVRGGLKGLLRVLRRKRDALNTLDLLERTRDLAARLCVDRDQRWWEAAELRPIQAMTGTDFTASLQ